MCWGIFLAYANLGEFSILIIPQDNDVSFRFLTCFINCNTMQYNYNKTY